ncbi:MAG: TolC family protein [Sphingomonadaceae bacterium]
MIAARPLLASVAAGGLAVLPLAAQAQPRNGGRMVPPVITAQPRSAAEAEDAERTATIAPPPLTGPQAPEAVFYGPPTPKSDDGEIPDISWTEPTDHVPPALEEAVNLVSRNYPSAMAARAALRAAEQDVRSAKWLRFPSAQGNLAYLDDSGSPEPQLIVETPLWSGGRISSGIARARAQEDVTSAGYIETVQDLALLTSQTYFQVASLTLREQLLAQSLEEHQRLVDTMERRVEQEISPIADLELARSRAAQIEQQFTVTQSSRRTSLRILAELIADPTFELGPIPYYDVDATIPNQQALEDQAVAYDPAIQRQRAEADVARAELDSRKASILPQVNAQYSYDDLRGSRVGLVLRAQSNGGLSQISDVNSARLRITSALENIRVAEQQLRRDIETTIIRYEAARKRAEISRTSASTASRVSASYTRQFIAGRRSWLDVMNALREAVTAEIDRTDAEITVMSAATELLLLSGRWRPVFDEFDPYETGDPNLNQVGQ